MNTLLSPPRFRSAPHPHPPLHPPQHRPSKPCLHRPFLPKTTPGSPLTPPKSQSGAPSPLPPEPKPSSPAPSGKRSVPAKQRNVAPAASHRSRGITSATTSPLPPPLRAKLSLNPDPSPSPRPSSPSPHLSRSCRNQICSLRKASPPNTSSRMVGRRMARRLNHGNTSQPRLRRRTPPCPSLMLPFPSPLLTIIPCSPIHRTLHQQGLIQVPKQSRDHPLPPSPPSWITGLLHGHDYRSYCPRLLSTCSFRSSTASCWVSGRYSQKTLSLDGLVGKPRDLEVQRLVSESGDDVLSAPRG